MKLSGRQAGEDCGQVFLRMMSNGIFFY